MKDGTFKIVAGPPKKREKNQKIAKNSRKLLKDSVDQHTMHLHDLAEEKGKDRARQRS